MSASSRWSWTTWCSLRVLLFSVLISPISRLEHNDLLGQEPQGFDAQIIGMDGTEQTGRFIGLSESSVMVADVSGTSAELPLDGVARLEFSDLASTPESEKKELLITIRLVDGTSLLASDLAIRGDEVTASLSAGELKASRRDVDWIRFSPLSEDPVQRDAWREIMEAETTGDLVVVAREVEGVRSLNSVEGVIGDLDQDGAGFKFDDQQIVVKYDRLDSLKFFHPVGRRITSLRGAVQTRSGDALTVKSWEMVEGKVQWSLACGASVTSELGSLRVIDFEAGRVTHVGDLEPTTFDWTPFVSAGEGNPEAEERLRSLFSFEKDRSFDGGPLTLFSQSGFGGSGDSLRAFSRGLALRSRTRLAYRVPEDHRRLVGWMGIDPQARPRGEVVVLIEADGRTLWSGTISGADSEPVKLDLDVENVSRLVVLVDFGNGGDLGDRIHWCEPRFVK